MDELFSFSTFISVAYKTFTITKNCFKRATDEGSLPEMVQYSPYFLPLNVFAASKGSNLYILFAITAAGVVPCGGPKKSPRTSSIVQIIFLLRSFEISKDIQSVQNTHV